MSEVRVVTGDMDFWSDEAPDGGDLLAALVAPLLPPHGHVLVLGPHAAGLLDLLAASPLQVSVLLRSRPDADLLAERHPHLSVLCGDLAGAADIGLPPADVLLAVGGLEPTSSADAPWRPWSRLADLAATLCAPDAVVVVGLERTVSAPLLGSAHRREADDRPDRWFPDLGHDATRPHDAAGLARAWGRPGASTSWLVGPSLVRPSLALPTHLAPDGPGTLAGALLERHAAEVHGAATDARPRVRDAVAAGLAATLAPAELVVLGAAVADDTVVAPPTDDVLVVEPAALATGADLLESRLLERCVRFDVPGLRDDLEAYRRWLDGTDGTISPLPQDVLLGDAGLRPVPGTGGTDVPADADDRFVGGLLHLARRLEQLGWARPWPRQDDADALVPQLAGLLDVEVPPEALDRAHAWVPGVPDDDTDLARRLREEVASLRGRARALENALRTRDRQLWTERALVSAVATVDERKELRREAKPPPAPPPSTATRVRRRLGRVVRRLR